MSGLTGAARHIADTAPTLTRQQRRALVAGYGLTGGPGEWWRRRKLVDAAGRALASLSGSKGPVLLDAFEAARVAGAPPEAFWAMVGAASSDPEAHSDRARLVGPWELVVGPLAGYQGAVASTLGDRWRGRDPEPTVWRSFPSSGEVLTAAYWANSILRAKGASDGVPVEDFEYAVHPTVRDVLARGDDVLRVYGRHVVADPAVPVDQVHLRYRVVAHTPGGAR